MNPMEHGYASSFDVASSLGPVVQSGDLDPQAQSRWSDARRDPPLSGGMLPPN